MGAIHALALSSSSDYRRDEYFLITDFFDRGRDLPLVRRPARLLDGEKGSRASGAAEEACADVRVATRRIPSSPERAE